MSPDVYGSAQPPRPTRPSTVMQLLHRLGQAAPYAILIYLIGFATLRIGLSPFLDVDEAAFVGRVDFQLIYPESSPPLFHWLTRLMLEATGWDWALSLAILRYGALALFYVSIWDTARRLAGHRAALLAVAAATLLPQIVWMSAVGLAQATLAMALAAAALNAMIRVFEDPTERNYVVFGAVAGLGMLSAFSFPIFLFAFLAATALEPELRYAFKRKSVYAAAAFGVLTLPLLVGVAIDFSDAVGGSDAIFADESIFRFIDPPVLGFDGVLSLAVAIVGWAGIGAAIWLGARAYDRTFGPLPGASHPFAPVLGRAMLYGLAGFAALALLANFHQIEPQWLSPLLAAFPVYLAVAWPLRRAALPLVGLALAALLLAAIGYWLSVRYTTHHLAAPYGSIAAQVARETEFTPAPIIAEAYEDGANLVLAREWPGATSPRTAPLENRAILVWRGDSDAPSDLAPEGFGQAGGVKSFVAPLLNESGEELFFSYQLYERLDPNARQIGAEDPLGEDAADAAAALEAAIETVIETEPEPRTDRPPPSMPTIKAGNLLPYAQTAPE